MGRARWAALGAAVAVSLGAGGFGIVRAASSSTPSAYVAIEPCRLADTRPAPDNVGPRSAPVGGDEAWVLDGWGTVGNCALPSATTALQLNVTALGPTEPTFLTLFPASGQRPTASNLNPVPGSPPTPNSATVPLDAGGRFAVYNRAGSVDVIIDVVGYYLAGLDANHDHDDRYASKQQSIMIPAPAFTPGSNSAVYSDNPGDGAYIQQIGGTQLDAPVILPVGSTIESVTYFVHDSSASYSLSLALVGITQPAKSTALQSTTSTVGVSGDATVTQTVGHVVVPDTAYFVRASTLYWGNAGNDLTIKGVRIDYTLP